MTGCAQRELAPDTVLPRVISAVAGEPLSDVLAAHRAEIEAELLASGGVLLRGFSLAEPGAFHAFAAGFGRPLMSYDFASTPRAAVGGETGAKVYTSTEYPASQDIPLHNEQSYTRSWPGWIWFHCVRPAEEGGRTPIGDSRRIYQRMPAAIRSRFAARRLMYVRNYGNGLDIPWESVFNTADRGEVERFCAARDIACEWKDDGTLRTRQVAQAVARHPVTGEDVWFNQANLFHVSALAPALREALEEAVDEEDLPRNVYYGDGAPLEEDLLDEVRAVIDAETVSFDWQRDDVMMLDNMLTAHGRTAFKGERRVLVAMA